MPPTDVNSAINQIVAVLRTVSGIENVPLNPPSVMSYTTFGLVYPSTGTFDANPTGTKKGLHNIAIDILSRDMDKANVINKIKPFIDSVSLALLRQISYDVSGNPGQRFGDTISTFEDVTYSFIPEADYGGVPVTGYHFSMNNTKLLTSL
jgi:hypothetical protein